MAENEVLVQIKGLSKLFPVRAGVFRKADTLSTPSVGSKCP